jgi:hypothetical protein
MLVVRTDLCSRARSSVLPVGSPNLAVAPPSFASISLQIQSQAALTTHHKRYWISPVKRPSQNHERDHMSDMQRRRSRVDSNVEAYSFLGEEFFKVGSFSNSNVYVSLNLSLSPFENLRSAQRTEKKKKTHPTTWCNRPRSSRCCTKPFRFPFSMSSAHLLHSSADSLVR